MSDNKGKLAPSTENYLIGKGFLIFRPVGETDFFHLGNVPTFEFTPAVTKLDHFSSQEGTKEKDDSIGRVHEAQPWHHADGQRER